MGERSLLREANQALDRALASSGAERDRLIDEALRLFRLAIKEQRHRAKRRSKPKDRGP